MKDPVKLHAPAKLNLFLHITGRRDDGYHLLETAFQFISLIDVLTFEVRGDDQLMLEVDWGEGLRVPDEVPGCAWTAAEPPTRPPDDPESSSGQAPLSRPQDDPESSSGQAQIQPRSSRITKPSSFLHDNLILRAARLLQPFAKRPAGCHIHLEKRIPIGAGLGGGSSDCATTLIALNTLWQCGLSKLELAKLGLQLGADVPIFVHGHAAFAQGVGEVLTEMNFPETWYILCVPPVSVETAKIFSDPQLTRDTSPCKIAALPEQRQNDCEAVTCRLHPQVQTALAALRQHLPGARMSGTGGAVFAACESQVHAQQVQARLGEQFGATWVVQGKNVSSTQYDEQ